MTSTTTTIAATTIASTAATSSTAAASTAARIRQCNCVSRLGEERIHKWCRDGGYDRPVGQELSSRFLICSLLRHVIFLSKMFGPKMIGHQDIAPD